MQGRFRRTQPSVLRGRGQTESTLALGFQVVHDDYRFDSDFFDMLYKLYTVTQDINTVNPPKSDVIPLKLRKKIRAVQYYLLSRKNHETSKVGDQLLKACRLGVLLYLGIIQNEFWVSPISEQLIWQLKSCLQSDTFTTDAMRALRL